MIDIFVSGQRLTIKQPIIASDTIEHLTAKVHFETEEWAGYTEITAYICSGDKVYAVPVVNGEISDAVEVSEGMWTIYMQGTTAGGTRIPTNADILWVTASGGIKGEPFVKVPLDINSQSYLIAKHAEYMAQNGGGGGGGLGFKKIGFTDDCDYVATEADGYTAFNTAISEANAGDTIIVMQGVYAGAEQLKVTKDVNFIGIGKPEISFPVWIQGGGIYSYETYTWEVLYPSVTSKWSGFHFVGGFSVGCEFDISNTGSAGYAYLEDCTINSEGYVNICGDVRNCCIDALSFASGHYYGNNGGTFEKCTIRVKNSMELFGATLKFCELYPATASSYEYYSNNIGSTSFSGCKMYAVGASLEIFDAHGGSLSLGDTLVFANSSYSGHLVVPTAK